MKKFHAVFALSLLSTIFVVVIGCADPADSKFTSYDFGEDRILNDGTNIVDFTEQTRTQANQRSASCMGCHKDVHDPHGTADEPSGAEPISCIDCHGGDGTAIDDRERAHPKAKHPEKWPFGGANPERTYGLVNDEHWDWIRFVNPGDLRVARVTCGPCHPDDVINVSKSVMATAAPFWGIAAYANGILPYKRTLFGESYSPEGKLQKIENLVRDGNDGWRPATDEEIEEHSLAPMNLPLPHWEITQTGNIYRVFEQGSRLGGPGLAFNGLPVPLVGIPDKLEDAGKPNNRLSDRGLGTTNRVDLPILNVHKTRLNDPHLYMFGTNDQPGDFRSSGCTACHMVYANDRDPIHSGPFAKFGNMGKMDPNNPDPYMKSFKDDPGHPIQHKLTKAIPSSQCMVCHMHQPNAFVNSYYGYQMWSYETDGEHFWPEEQKYPTHKEFIETLLRNPEEAATKGLWGDLDFLKESAVIVNPKAKHTQFADYHGHGWMFRGVFKMNRKGDLLDKNGKVIPYDDPDKFKGVIPLEGVKGEHFKKASEHVRRAVHMKDIHAEYDMHCVDCHFKNDSHGDGNLYAEFQAAVEIRCQDCHGTVSDRAKLVTSGPATRAPGHSPLDMRSLKTPWRKAQFEKREDGTIIQRSMLHEDKEWEVTQVRDSVTEGTPTYNKKAAYAKTIERDNRTWGNPDRSKYHAHGEEGLECYTCHTSWVTACFGCHLPQQANVKTPVNHFENKDLRNYASYNPQVVRDAEFMLGVSGDVKGNTIAPVRSSSGVMISSEDAQRRRIYSQIMTMGGNGMSSQLFNTHFAHTVRKTETRVCSDCHLSEKDDNNAWLAQVMLLGTNQVGFMGFFAYVGMGADGFQAVPVTEWDEPQAVIGSNLHRLVYPDHYRKFVEGGRLYENSRSLHHGGSMIRSLQLRGEYLYTASGPGGFRVYDVANVHNKDFSEKVITSPVSPLGQDTHISTTYATAFALPFNNPTSMARVYRPSNKETPYPYKGKDQNLHELYRYAYVTDRVEGLIVVNVDVLTDGDPQNNFIERAATFNPGGILNGAENLALAGTTVYVCCDRGVVAVDIDDPLSPRVIAEVNVPNPRSIAVQFRYAFVCDNTGVKVLDITHPERMRLVEGAQVAIKDARDIYVAKTYGYVSAGAEGLVILDLERPLTPRVDQVFNGGGAIDDLNQVKVATTNDSVYAYMADGKNGLRVAQLITPNDGGRSAYGFAPQPRPRLIGQFPTFQPALAVSKALDRDRAVDESGNQTTLFGRIGGRPMNLEEMRKLFLDPKGRPYKVSDHPK